MKSIFKYIKLIFVCLMLQACLPEAEHESVSSENIVENPLEPTSDVLAIAKSGLQTYNESCEQCHGNIFIWSGKKSLPTEDAIFTSLRNVNAMAFLKNQIDIEQSRRIAIAMKWSAQYGNFDPIDPSNPPIVDSPPVMTPPITDEPPGNGPVHPSLPNHDKPVDFIAAKSIIDTACTSCHFNSHAAWKNYSVEDFVNTGLIVKGDPDRSSLIKRIKFYGASNSNMPISSKDQPILFEAKDYSKLVRWIKDMKSDPIAPVEDPAVEGDGVVKAPRINRAANGRYLQSVFMEVFVDDFQSLKKHAKANILSLSDDPATFGGSCNFYDTRSGTDCSGSITATMSSDVDGEFSVVKAMNKRVVCEKALPGGAKVAAGKFGFNTQSPIKDSDIQTVHSLFYRTREISAEEMSALRKFINNLNSAGVRNVDQWGALFLIICEQPGWEHL